MGAPRLGSLEHDDDGNPVVTPTCPYVVAWHLMRHVGSELDLLAAADLKRSHLLHPGDYLILLALRVNGTMRMGDLARETLMIPSRLTARVDDLVIHGHVERTKSDTDARGVLITVTDLGLKYLAVAEHTHSVKVMELLAQRLDKAEVQQLITLLGRIADERPLPNYLAALQQDYNP